MATDKRVTTKGLDKESIGMLFRQVQKIGVVLLIVKQSREVKRISTICIEFRVEQKVIIEHVQCK